MVEEEVLKLIGLPRSQLLFIGIEAFTQMVEDPIYILDDMSLHSTLISGEVAANFGGALIRKLMGSTFDCTVENLFKNSWAPFVCQLNHLRRGELRACYGPKIEDKIWKKFFKSDVFPINHDYELGDPRLLGQLTEFAEYIKRAGM